MAQAPRQLEPRGTWFPAVAQAYVRRRVPRPIPEGTVHSAGDRNNSREPLALMPPLVGREGHL